MASGRKISLIGVALLLAAVAAGAATDPGEKVINDKSFHNQLLEVASTYVSYGRIDDEFRWAPWLCRMPNPGKPHFSASKDAGTHGQKLYSLFVRQRADYMVFASKPTPIGQTIVKESWVPEEVKDVVQRKTPIVQRCDATGKIIPPGKKELDSNNRLDHFSPYAQKDGKQYRAAKKAELFIMIKVDPKTPNTDDGWIYGTVSADGKTVTSAGRVASCMKCHEPRKERLFGLRP